MQTGKYTGIGLIGNENIAAIYAVNNGIVDINGTGIYHLFYKTYAHDLIQSAVSLIRVKDTIYYGNKVWKKYTHPTHIKPVKTYVEDTYRYCDEFLLEEHGLKRKDVVYSYGEHCLSFEMELENVSEEELEIGCYGYCAVRNDMEIETEKMHNGTLGIHTGDAYMVMKTPWAEEIYAVEDSPTDFAYQVFLDILEKRENSQRTKTSCRLGYVQGRTKTLKPGDKLHMCWSLIFGDSYEELEKELCLSEEETFKAAEYWENWMAEGEKPEDSEFQEQALVNLTALKAVCVGGYIPADLTGHYFCNKMPCYYARDSIMVARAFLLSGHLRECRDIIAYLIGRKRKENGEFFQRYDGYGEPNEGANNSVFHQIDSIGYFCRIVYEYYKKTGELLADETLLMEVTDVIDGAEKKSGMAGPEGGVNEGVFGPAFITSSNMFIYGGILAAKQIFAILGNKEYAEKCRKICDRLYEGIQSAYNEELGRFDYGYVTYHDHTVRKYDTPQYFGPLYGYPNDEKMQNTHIYLRQYASFFEDGIGYSEQEYHHGPWLFNTLACAEYCKRAENREDYIRKMKWASEHSNAYGLLPEAVDANDEGVCVINPLSWACGEFAAAYFSKGGFVHEK